jgi:hypothetical protein
MKNLYQVAGILLGAYVLLASCGNGSDDSGTYDDFEPYMEARINGELIATNDAWLVDNQGDWVVNPCFYAVMGAWDANAVSDRLDRTLKINFDPYVIGDLQLDASATYGVRNENNPGEMIYYWTIDYCEDSERPEGYNIFNDIAFTISPRGNNIYRGTFSFEVSNNCRENVVVIEGEFEVKSEFPMCQ